MSSSKQNSKQKLSTQASLSKIAEEGTFKNKLKIGGKLNYSAHNLKKIARLPDNDRKQVLKIFMKKVCRRRGVKKSDVLSHAISKGSHVSDSFSSASVNNDWKNWVMLHGKEKMVKNDVNCFGKAMGVKFYMTNLIRSGCCREAGNKKKDRVEVVEEGVQKV